MRVSERNNRRPRSTKRRKGNQDSGIPNPGFAQSRDGQDIICSYAKTYQGDEEAVLDWPHG